jgi:hypothetical protein
MKFFRRYILAGKFFLVHFSSVKPLGFFTDENADKKKLAKSGLLMSHVCGVAAIVHPQVEFYFYLYGKYRETRHSCVVLVENGMRVAT